VMSKSNLSENAKSSILNDLDMSLRLLKSGMNSKSDITPPISEKVGSINDAIVVYGDLLVEFSQLIRSQSLTTISEILRADKIYITGKSVEGITHNTTVNGNNKLRLKQIIDQLILLENWLEE